MIKSLITLLSVSTLAFNFAAAQEFSDVRWKETSRTDQRKKSVTYTDTFYLNSVSKSEMNLRRGSFIYKGKLEGRILQLGHIAYIVLKNTTEEIHLQDEDFIHIFTREIKDQSAADASKKIAAINLPEKPVSEIKHELLNGDWESYKRASKKGPLEKIDYKTLIKTLSFGLQKPEDYHGSITTTFVGGQALYYIRETKGANLVVDDKEKKEHLIKVWKLTEEELIIEDENEIVYYMKHFK